MKKTPVAGFISAPAWFDPAPAEFPKVVEENVSTQQAPLLLPDFDYRLESIASVQAELDLCARSLAAAGCDIAAQVGSPFAWANATSESEARARAESMSVAANIPVVMTGLAIVDGLRSLGAKSIALDCTYYERDWRDAFASFMEMCGFDVLHASTMADQGLVHESAKMEEFGWSMTGDLAARSILAAAQSSPRAQAIVVTGAGTRTLGFLADMERRVEKPVVAADTVVYWALARRLNLRLTLAMGRIAGVGISS